MVLSPEERAKLPHPEHTHRWTVAVRSAASVPDSDIVGGADDISYFIKRVTFKLHESFDNPTRSKFPISMNFFQRNGEINQNTNFGNLLE